VGPDDASPISSGEVDTGGLDLSRGDLSHSVASDVGAPDATMADAGTGDAELRDGGMRIVAAHDAAASSTVDAFAAPRGTRSRDDLRQHSPAGGCSLDPERHDVRSAKGLLILIVCIAAAFVGCRRGRSFRVTGC